MDDTCIWIPSNENRGEDSRTFETECSNIMLFISGGIVENNYYYCPYCGGIIIEEAVK